MRRVKINWKSMDSQWRAWSESLWCNGDEQLTSTDRWRHRHRFRWWTAAWDNCRRAVTTFLSGAAITRISHTPLPPPLHLYAVAISISIETVTRQRLSVPVIVGSTVSLGCLVTLSLYDNTAVTHLRHTENTICLKQKLYKLSKRRT